ncbi:NAD(P)/FAD-dependent oxidoreductase [Leekyejoonella antrihumi]|uniref:NAD(P)/FAD-dependent oxidoreductase n=1 Tax=Leekyejoonella antrihumi TaxID=1660198 RepID=UPI001FE3C893|nr:FAD-dependent oxidoreductase [Leekyejoonella antrihumi]
MEVDIAIVGGGYTGLWTAYYLAKADPTLRIAVLEKNFVGFGASGRNGGWCSAIFPATLRKVAATSSRSEAIRMQQAMFDTVEEIRHVVDAEKIDCDFQRGGYVSVARNNAQWARSRQEVENWREWGFGEEHMRLLNADEATKRLAASHVHGGTFTPHCAAVQPAKLVHGLANAVRALGVKIFESTEVRELRSRSLSTAHGTVRADVVVRATEGYTAQIRTAHRAIVPMYSLMIATAPLPERIWQEIGLRDRETFSDKRHLRIYGQRTREGRLAFGGRGAPYHFGSRVKPDFDDDKRVHAMLRSILLDLFPMIKGVPFTHAWGGNLGIPRDWYPSVSYDPRSGMAHAGGYIGDGVATTNLAGRTLAAEIVNLDTDIRTLPWVNRTSPQWEPEPLRWVGVNAGTAAFNIADRSEARFGKPSRLASGLWRALGH